MGQRKSEGTDIHLQWATSTMTYPHFHFGLCDCYSAWWILDQRMEVQGDWLRYRDDRLEVLAVNDMPMEPV